MDVKEIDINKIKEVGNIRSNLSKDGIANLMSSIKQDGLLQPIGLQQIPGKDEYQIIYGYRRLEACKKLGWQRIPAVIKSNGLQVELKDLIIQNTVENIQREDVSTAEQGRIFYILKKDYKMTDSELASRFSIPLEKIKTALTIYLSAPEEYKEKIKYIGKGRRKKGNIPTTTANKILQMRKFIGKDNVGKLLEYAKQDNITAKHVNFISYLLKLNYSLSEAIDFMEDYTLFYLRIPIKTEYLNNLVKRYKRNKQDLFLDIISGDLQISLDILKLKKLTKKSSKKKYIPDFKISNGSIPLVNSSSVIENTADDKLRKNWHKFSRNK